VKNRNSNTTLFTFTDTLNNPYELSDFKRVITDANGNKKTYLLKDGKVLLYFEKMNVGYIKPKPKQSFVNPKILTLDFETRDIEIVDNDTGVVNKVKVPICLCIYDGKTPSFYFLFKDPNN
jgi:hypothetical protein